MALSSSWAHRYVTGTEFWGRGAKVALDGYFPVAPRPLRIGVGSVAVDRSARGSFQLGADQMDMSLEDLGSSFFADRATGVPLDVLLAQGQRSLPAPVQVQSSSASSSSSGFGFASGIMSFFGGSRPPVSTPSPAKPAGGCMGSGAGSNASHPATTRAASVRTGVAGSQTGAGIASTAV